MRRGIFTIMMAALVLGVAGIGVGHAASDGQSEQKTKGQQLNPQLPGLGNQDQEFAYSAHAMLIPEIEISELGAEKADDPEVVALSKEMAQEYKDLANELETAAQAAGFDATKGEAPHGENRLERLQDSGSEFDLAYIIEQRGLHKKLIAIYSMEKRAGEKEPLKEHAEKGLEVLSKNYEKIEQIEARLREARTHPTR
jgi:predicted outer membrane protein